MDLIWVDVEERDENGFLLAMKESGDLSVDAWPYAKPGGKTKRSDKTRIERVRAAAQGPLL